MKRDDVIRILARHHTDEIVVPLYQAAFEWMEIKPWPLTLYAFGAMGTGSSHGLGLALGRPDKRVLVFDGDGSLLMNLGSLVTIAEAAPPNLIHFVFENGVYEANGSLPIPGQDVVSFAGFARSAGIPSVYEFDNIEAFEAEIGAILKETGPVFVCLKVEKGGDYPYRWDVIHGPESRDAFRKAMRET
ncbi:MAG: thiamine pyrophosphate-binding protein [Rhodospirillaceae bacterium]|nr:thiamine pyrophosphate-binding protein [Rhodospirillaceae bacterium]|tara:strand:+ start:1190 stop:1753 length:564 start_codon:yes stop_codon:yes gene_type:complete